MVKKLVFVLAAMSGFAYGACSGPYCYDDVGATVQARVDLAGPMALKSDTSANILARNAKVLGELMICTDCTGTTTGIICLSTTTGISAYAHYPSTGSKCN